MDYRDYALAKELKDAGFPQDRSLWVWYTCQTDKDVKPHNILRIRNTLTGYNAGEVLSETADPTLEELIEACGNDFYELRNEGIGFIAWNDCEGGGQIGGRGATPRIAVALLYLSINKK